MGSADGLMPAPTMRKSPWRRSEESRHAIDSTRSLEPPFSGSSREAEAARVRPSKYQLQLTKRNRRNS
jgi:hypothetical protein